MSTRRIFRNVVISNRTELKSAVKQVYILLKADRKHLGNKVKNNAYGCKVPPAYTDPCAITILSDCLTLLTNSINVSILPRQVVASFNRYVKLLESTIKNFNLHHSSGILPNNGTLKALKDLLKMHTSFFNVFNSEAYNIKVQPQPNDWMVLKTRVVAIWNGRALPV